MSAIPKLWIPIVASIVLWGFAWLAGRLVADWIGGV
jgi:hypothetical protein